MALVPLVEIVLFCFVIAWASYPLLSVPQILHCIIIRIIFTPIFKSKIESLFQ